MVAENVPEVLVAGVALEALGVEESEEVPGARLEVCPVAGVVPLALVPILPQKRPKGDPWRCCLFEFSSYEDEFCVVQGRRDVRPGAIVMAGRDGTEVPRFDVVCVATSNGGW